MKTKAEWLAFLRGLGFDSGDMWHLLHDLHHLGLVKPEPNPG